MHAIYHTSTKTTNHSVSRTNMNTFELRAPFKSSKTNIYLNQKNKN